MSNFKPVTNFWFWCQKVLPLVYDDSISYYEVLCKMSEYLNQVIDNVNTLPDIIDEAVKEYIESGEIQGVLNEMLQNFNPINVKNPPAGLTPANGDGETDDTAALQAMIEYGAEHNLPMIFPAGVYRVTSLNVPETAYFWGVGNPTIFKAPNSENALITVAGDFTAFNMDFNGNIGGNVAPADIITGTAENISLAQCNFAGCVSCVDASVSNILDVAKCHFSNYTDYAIHADGTGRLMIDGMEIDNVANSGAMGFVKINTNNSIVKNLTSLTAVPVGVEIAGDFNSVEARIPNCENPVSDEGQNNSYTAIGQVEKRSLQNLTENIAENSEENVGSEKNITANKIRLNPTQALSYSHSPVMLNNYFNSIPMTDDSKEYNVLVEGANFNTGIFSGFEPEKVLLGISYLNDDGLTQQHLIGSFDGLTWQELGVLNIPWEIQNKRIYDIQLFKFNDTYIIAFDFDYGQSGNNSGGFLTTKDFINYDAHFIRGQGGFTYTSVIKFFTFNNRLYFTALAYNNASSWTDQKIIICSVDASFNVTFVRALTLSNTPSPLDPFIGTYDGKTYLYVKNENNKKLDVYSTPDLTTFTFIQEEDTAFGGEGYCFIAFNDTCMRFMDSNVSGVSCSSPVSSPEKRNVWCTTIGQKNYRHFVPLVYDGSAAMNNLVIQAGGTIVQNLNLPKWAPFAGGSYDDFKAVDNAVYTIDAAVTITFGTPYTPKTQYGDNMGIRSTMKIGNSGSLIVNANSYGTANFYSYTGNVEGMTAEVVGAQNFVTICGNFFRQYNVTATYGNFYMRRTNLFRVLHLYTVNTSFTANTLVGIGTLPDYDDVDVNIFTPLLFNGAWYNMYIYIDHTNGNVSLMFDKDITNPKIDADFIWTRP